MNKKVIIITGASGGIGSAISKKFSNDNLILVARDKTASLNKLSEELNGNCTLLKADVSNIEDVERIVNTAISKYNKIDILINNAGISEIGLIQDMNYEKWHELINTNLSSCYYLSKNVIPYMIKKKSGHIINISSMWGRVGASCEVAYSASKGGINSFTLALAKELAPSGIFVGGLSCGLIDTPMNSHLDKSDLDRLIEDIPINRMGTCDEVAEIVYSMSNLPLLATGQIIKAEGGMI